MPPDLWNFAQHLYAQPGAEAHCLALQADGVDVCLLLTAFWLERSGVSGSSERYSALQALAQHWQQEVITPLRAVRQAWRDAAQTDSELKQLRQQLLTLELQAERTALQRMQELSSAWGEEEGGKNWVNGLELDRNPQRRTALDSLRSAAELL